MRRTLSAAVLVLAFCCPAAAGTIHNPPPEPPPPPPEKVVIVPESADAETYGAETAPSGLSDSLTEMTFELLALLPALF